MLHAFSILLSSFLLFQVQLILGKFLLPWFGGTPSVWTTCMLFFQTMLLGGYAYAFAIDRFCSAQKQRAIHITLLSITVVSIAAAYCLNGSPILPHESAKPTLGNESPITQLLGLLVVAIGLPFLALAANSPLIQRWSSYASNEQPYRLYAVSNIGSLAGLLSYPFLIEPSIGLQKQAMIWAFLFLAFVGVTALCAFRIQKIDTTTTITEEPRSLRPAMTLLLAACPACLLLAVTNDLCQEVAVVPFMWVLPLSIYLISFIICFDKPGWYRRELWLPIAYTTTIVVLITSLKGIQLSWIPHAISYSAFLFSICMICHGELYRLRPDTRKLTAFYLLIATGGVIGSAVVAIIAPLYFNGYWEFTIAVLATWVGLAWLYWKDGNSVLHTGSSVNFYLFVLLIAYVCIHYAFYIFSIYEHDFFEAHKELLNILGAILTTGCVSLLTRGRTLTLHTFWPRLLLGSVIFIAECFAVFDVRRTAENAIVAERNFYGTIRVVEKEDQSDPPVRNRRLIHGNILHGTQVFGDGLEFAPNAYYTNDSGIGLAINQHPLRVAKQPLKVGVTGLGVGGISAHLKNGDEALFFEINPLVTQLAFGSDAVFTYLNQSPAKVDVIGGDARITLEQLLQKQGSLGLDVLALDAFTSDAIPTHLLTVEAMKTYLAHLKDDDSILAINISNRFLSLEDPVLNLAKHYGLHISAIFSLGDAPFSSTSKWILLCRNATLLNSLKPAPTSFLRNSIPESEILWTDDYSNLLKVLKNR